MAIISDFLALFQRIGTFLSALGGLEQLNVVYRPALRWWSACRIDSKVVPFFVISVLSSPCQAANMEWKYSFTLSVRGKLTMKF